MTREADVVVLGGGPGGYAAALRSADLGAEVALVEGDLVGGTCLHRGCVPTRAMLHAASIVEPLSRSAGHWGLKTSFDGVDVAQLLAARDDVVHRNHVAVEAHLSKAGVEVVRGWGRLTGRSTVSVNGDSVTARRAVIVATGSQPRLLDGAAPDGERVLTSDHAMKLERIPESALILGGGAVGAEFSQIWSTFGTKVTLVEIEPHLVPFEDEDVGRELMRALRGRGIDVRVGTTVVDLHVRDGSVDVTLSAGTKVGTLSVDIVLLAIGRTPATSGLGYEESGVELTHGFVDVRDRSTLETNAHGVYAVGDLLGPPSVARAHVAYAEGMLAAEAIAGEKTRPIDHSCIPRVTHGLTETACVGLSEAEARATAADIDVMKMPIGGVARGLMIGDPGMVKIVAERGGPVLGIHIVGPLASELSGEAATVTSLGVSPAEVSRVIRGHPTLSETFSELNLALAGRPLHRR